MHISLVVCVNKLGEIIIGQQQALSTMVCALHASNVSQGLHTSYMACAHLANNVGQWNRALRMMCDYLLGNIYIGKCQVASPKAYALQESNVDSERQHQLRHARINHGMCTSSRQHRWSTNSKQHQPSPVCFEQVRSAKRR